MKLRNLLTLCMIALGNIAYGQTLPPNIDFETGTTSNWEYYIGSCCPIVAPSGILPVGGRHDIVTGTGTDIFGGFPIVSPTGGGFSLQLGNSTTGGQAEKARYYVNIPTGSSYKFIYHYAIVLEDPVHAPVAQPRMEIKAFDSATGAVLPCDSFYYVSSSTLPGFSVSPVPGSGGSIVYYLPWKTGTLDFTGYGGHTIGIDFSVGDCGYGGHMGYGYVDISAGVFVSAITCTTATVTLTGPSGYSSYDWYDSSTFSSSLGTTQSITILAPAVPTTYAVISIPYPGYGCLDTMYLRVIPTVPCSGTPSIGTSYYTSSRVCGDPDTITASGYSAVCGLTFQWESSTDNIHWTVIPGANYLYYPLPNASVDMYYRVAVTCTASGLSNYSSSTFVPYLTGPGLFSVVNPPDSICNGANFYVSTCGTAATYNVITYYGDGTHDTVSLTATGTRYADFIHYYGFPGTYTVKQILHDGTMAVDSTTYSYNYLYCSTIPIKIFYDDNGDCLYDSTESYLRSPVFISVDSNSVPIDTVSVTSGMYYNTNGGPGTNYDFRVLAPPYVAVMCPTSGILHDTIQSFVNLYGINYFGLECIPGNFDFSIYDAVSRTNIDMKTGDIYINNLAICDYTASTVTFNFSPKYEFHSSSPPPTTLSGNTATWNFGSLTSPTTINYWLRANPTTGLLTAGDTVHSEVIITPIAGDYDTTNNRENRCDTARGSWDPNFIEVVPAGCIPSGIRPVELRYTIHFENMGNDTAHNIYLLDTLSDNLDPRTLEIVTASHRMDVAMMNVGGHNIVKFDYPNIKLLDSSYHGLCDGMVIYKIKTRAGLADGVSILNRAGIYFDINPVVMTNTVENVIGCPLLNVQEVSKEQTMQLYPNPTKDELVVKMSSTMNGTLEVTNQVGQVLMKQTVNSTQTKVNIKTLPAGLYFITLKDGNGSTVQKFVKM